jgi:hypothetical protein
MNINNYLIECITQNIPVSYSKYGDGEYLCAINYQGSNCDNDSYTNLLRDSLINSFKYMVDNTNNAYIGKWPEYNEFWENLVKNKINWADYYTLIIDNINNTKACDKLTLYKIIKQSKLKKIIICNPLLIKSKLLLNIDDVVIIPLNNWFDSSFSDILSKVKKLIDSDGNHIVMTCCGMGAKVLIAELHKIFPKGIYLDFGSALDLICTKTDSRGYSNTYEECLTFFKDIISDNWNDKCYDKIYIEASNKLGLHIKNK